METQLHTTGIKVCHVTSVHPQEDVRIFHKECVALAEAGYTVSLLVLGGRDETIKGITIRGIGTKQGNRLKRGYYGSKTILEAAIREQADVYHLHDPELLFIARKLKRKTGAKVLFDSHEYVPDQILDKTWIPAWMRKTVSVSYKKWQDSILNRLDGLVIVTPDHVPFFSHLRIPVRVVANYPIINNEPFAERPSEGPLRFVYIGGLFPTRGIRELVQAIAHIDAELHLAGAFHPETFQEELSALPGWKKVVFHGFLDKNAVRELLSRSHVGLVTLHPTPSYLKSLPVKLFEYMEIGIPFISSDFDAFKRVVGDVKCCVFADPKDVGQIENAMRFFVEHRGDLNAMGKAGYDLVREKYTWKGQAVELVDFYEKLLAV